MIMAYSLVAFVFTILLTISMINIIKNIKIIYEYNNIFFIIVFILINIFLIFATLITIFLAHWAEILIILIMTIPLYLILFKFKSSLPYYDKYNNIEKILNKYQNYLVYLTGYYIINLFLRIMIFW